jgi:methylmalonyl-CoA/ethylmalonyl-CoA epimerase
MSGPNGRPAADGAPDGKPASLQAHGLDLPEAKFDHVAHAARQIADLLPLYRDLLGGRFTSGAANQELGYRTLHLAYGDGSKIELMEPLPGSHFLDSFFARNPLGGLHHITFRVPSLDAALAAARAAGLQTFGESRELAGWSEAFIHPRVAHGTIVQIAEADDDFPPGATVSLEAFLAGR